MLAIIKKDWTRHVLPPACVAIAARTLVLTPIWALQWYVTRFLGMLLEPNPIVSESEGPGWPASSGGVVWTDPSEAPNGKGVTDTLRVETWLRQNGPEPVDVQLFKDIK